MSISVRVAITAPDLSGWREAVDPAGVHKVLGLAYQDILVAHFRAKNRKPNAKGFPRANGGRGFWDGVADKTAFDPATDADESGATITIGDKPGEHFALRYFGGPVTPKKAKYLAIPLTAEAAAARRPREVDGLFLLRGRNGNKFLARKTPAGLERLFLLTKSTTHRPDPTALPPEAKTAATLSAKAEANIRRKLSQA